MSDSAKPSWPDLTSLPFTMFGAPSTPPAAANPATQPFMQGLAGGMDAVRSFWGSLPGGTAMPGFLVPTLDVEELDKRVSDLRAAEQWLEVNLNMLRATIQGLEVQRHTIAALNSFTVMSDAAKPKEAPALPKTMINPVERFANLWPMPQAPKPQQAAPAEEDPPPAPPEEPPPEAGSDEAPAAESAAEPPADGMPATAGAMLANVAANNWLGFMQEQFMKVAQAAIAGSSPAAPDPADGTDASAAPARKARAKPAVKKTAKPRRAPAQKES